MKASEINIYTYRGQVTLTSKHLAIAKGKCGLSILDGTLSIIEPASRASLVIADNTISGTEHLFQEITFVPASGMLFEVPLNRYQRTRAKVTSFRLTAEEWQQGLVDDSYSPAREESSPSGKRNTSKKKEDLLAFLDLI